MSELSDEPNLCATGLKFPEGPIWLPNGDVLLVEIARGTLTAVSPDGHSRVVASPGGGPNGAAIGPDGHCYICNNGGFEWHENNGRLYPGLQPENYSGGRIERVNLSSGAVEVLFDRVGDERLKGPNDLVFDAHGGFWFTDHGKQRQRDKDRTGAFYAARNSDGSYSPREVIFPLEGPNGIGLSPAGDELYIAETPTGRLWAWSLSAPGVVDGPGRVVRGREGYFMFDSLAVQADGRVAVATLIDGGISVLDPEGGPPEFVSMPDRLTTNICFGGANLDQAWITLSSTGQLVSLPWGSPGLKLA